MEDPAAPFSDGLRGEVRVNLAKALAMMGDYPRARTECFASLAGNVPNGIKVNWLDQMACLPLFYGLQGYTEEALDWIDRAIALAPNKLTLQGTRGSLLVEAGCLDEGRGLLEKVRAASSSPVDQGIGALYLAIVARRQGRIDAGDTLAAEAFRLYPGQPWMETRWERELASESAPATPRPVGGCPGHIPAAVG